LQGYRFKKGHFELFSECEERMPSILLSFRAMRSIEPGISRFRVGASHCPE
jgi:hypothetical protein